MAVPADSKKLYIPLATIYGNKDADGNYNLSALDVKNLNDNLWSIVKKVQGGITLADLNTLTVEELRSNVVISNTVITQNLYAVYGDIAELTVDRLVSADKVQRYANADTSDINYVWIQDRSIKLMTGTTTGATTQHTNRNGNLLYWKDAAQQSMDTAPTVYPVTVYAYTELCKAQFSFDNVDGVYVPRITLGAGTGDGDNGKAFIYKPTDQYVSEWFTDTGERRAIVMDADGIHFIGDVDMETGGIRLYVQPDEPTGAEGNDVWVDTDYYEDAGKAFFKSPGTTYQSWDGFPDSPVPTVNYPYQTIGTFTAAGPVDLYYLFCSPVPIMGPINPGKYYKTYNLAMTGKKYRISGGVWVLEDPSANAVTFQKVIASTEYDGFLQSNCDIYTSATLTTVSHAATIASSLSAWIPIASGAENIPYDNSATGMTANDVQEAIDELFQSVSDGKTDIATAITDKGGTASGSDTFTELADAIEALPTGGGTYQSKNVTPNAAGQTVTPDGGFDALSSVTINGDTDLLASNIKSGINIFGVTGNYTGGGGSLPPTYTKATISSATASSQYDATFAPGNAFDGNITTRWVSLNKTGTQYIQFDLGSTKMIGKIKAMCGASYVPEIFSVQTSTNGTDFTTVESEVRMSVSDTLREAYVAMTLCRYIRLVMVSSNASFYELKEFEAYEVS
jgi:hypothetical protein